MADALAKALANAPPRPPRVEIVVIGGGRMGDLRGRHVAASLDAALAGVVDPDAAAAAKAATLLGCAAFSSLASALAAKPNAQCWICAPTKFHPALIEEAANAGRHVACEKPVGLDPKQIADAYDVCAFRNVGLHCAFQRRSDAAYAELRRRVAAGAVGAPRSIRCVFRDHPTPAEAFLLGGGGDVYHDLATHDIDFALALARDAFGGGDAVAHAPDEVYAVGSSSTPALAAAAVHDAATVVVTWRQRGGLVATFDLSRSSAYGYDQRCEVFGDSGAALSVENPSAMPLRCADAAGVGTGPRVHSFPERFRGAFERDVAGFVESCRGGGEPLVSRADAVLATLVAEAARRSSELRRPVRLVNAKSSSDPADLALDG